MNLDESATFRQARLLLLLSVIADGDPDGLDVERLGVYDFLAMHPLLVARRGDDPDRLTLRLAGFDDGAAAYASPAQRFVTAQQFLARDLTALVDAGLVTRIVAGRIRYRLTAAGASLASQFTAMYSQSYLTAARIVIRRARRLSGRKLRESLRRWLTMSSEGPPSLLDPIPPLGDERVPDAPPSGDSTGRTPSPKDMTFPKDLT
jgi:hypothetical protein